MAESSSSGAGREGGRGWRKEARRERRGTGGREGGREGGRARTEDGGVALSGRWLVDHLEGGGEGGREGGRQRVSEGESERGMEGGPWSDRAYLTSKLVSHPVRPRHLLKKCRGKM